MKIPPFATASAFRMKTHGAYAGGGPLGAIVHFTAGHDGAENTIRDGAGKGYAYWCIQRDGRLFCAHSADEWGYHAGESRWKNLVGGVSDDLIGIELCAGGRLTVKNNRLYTWFGNEIPKEDARYCDGSSEDQCEGWYHAYTPAQEATLANTLIWLAREFPKTFSFDRVLGHCEVSGKLGIGYWRKNDPSAALSMTMPQFRASLKRRVQGGS